MTSCYLDNAIAVVATQSVGDIDLIKVVDYLNSPDFKTNYIYSGRFKIGHRQLCNSLCNFTEML